MHVEEPLVVVHPNLCHASRINPMRVVGDEVRVEWTEDVTNVAGEFREGHEKGDFGGRIRAAIIFFGQFGDLGLSVR